MKTLIIGATGATGNDLLQLLLATDAVESVDIFVRRPVSMQHPKLHVHIIDFDQPAQWLHLVKGDVLFSCLGTTLKAAGSKEAQKKVDYHYQLWFAKAASDNGVERYVLVSSAYASSKSPFFYAKIKGLLEDDVRALPFAATIIFNPPTLVRPNSQRTMEVLATKLLNFLNSLGLLKSMQPLETAVLARAMLNASIQLPSGAHSFESNAIRQLAGSHTP